MWWAWPTQWNPISTKNTKLSREWWYMPIIPAAREDEAGESLEPGRQRLQWAKSAPLHPSLGKRARFHLKKINKITKISRAWWHVPVIPATQEAEAGGSLEPRRQRFQWTEIAPWHSSLGNRVRLCLKKIKIKKLRLLRWRGIEYARQWWF